MGVDDSTPALVGERLYAFGRKENDEVIQCLEDLVDAGQIVLALTVNSDPVAFKPSEKEYTEIARIKVAETETWAHPVIDGKRVFVRDRDSVALWAIE